jgi:ketose-bisphosphate aldolase
MPLVNMNKMLREARTANYAVGAFNILDYLSAKAVIDGAAALGAPVILQTSEKTVRYWGFKAVVSWVRELTSSVDIPVALHLDHCTDIEFIHKCINEGWTSVMIDASSKPLEENIRMSREVVGLAHPCGVSVEAELGEIGGIEDDIKVDAEHAHLADPEKAKYFLAQVKVDCFAPAIGTAHGLYKGEPKIAFDRLAEINNLSEVPLALHGGTGLPGNIIKKAISLGCAKVNISTQLKHEFIEAFVNYYQTKPDEYNPLKLINAQYLAIKNVVAENIRIFETAGKNIGK